MARSFSSGDVIVGSNTNINFERTNTFSVHLLVRLQTATTVAESLVGHLDTAASFRGWEIEKTSAGGNFVVYLISSFATTNRISKNSLTVPTHDGVTWTGFGFTYDGSSTAAGINLYLNGAIDNGTAAVGLTLTIQNSVALRFGKRLDGSEPFTGAMAEVGIWDVALDAAEMNALGLRGYSPLMVRNSALVGYWPLVGRTSPEIDYVGQQGGALTGTAANPHPRIIKPKPRTMPWIPAETVSV